jgi:hypothetical protein
MRYPVKPCVVGGYCFAIGTLLGVAACSTGPAPQAGEPGSGAAPLIYLSSLRAPTDVTDCLRGRLPRVRASRHAGATELEVGSGSRADDWLITLMPSATGGTVVKVQRPPSGEGNPEEPEMRFHVARCVT